MNILTSIWHVETFKRIMYNEQLHMPIYLAIYVYLSLYASLELKGIIIIVSFIK